MHVHIVFAHPSHRSFSFEVLAAFTEGLRAAGHTHSVSDLYAEDFRADMDEDQYLREVSLDPAVPPPEDVLREQEKVDGADCLAFVFPLWWSDVPARLKGWFDRVWTNGWAYRYVGEERFSSIRPSRALMICSAGHTAGHLAETGVTAAMERILLDDRLRGVGLTDARLEILGGMMPGDDTHRAPNLERARDLGRDLG